MLYQIFLFCLFCLSLDSAEQLYLKTPNISQEDIIGTSVGIRPYRKTGVRLEAESIQAKLIIHNYGYGGSGLTLSFGGSAEVLEILDHHNTSSNIAAVLGAGVIGLSTAYDLLDRGYEVHLYADQWSPHLTSNVAAGIWSPPLLPSDLPEDKKQLNERMLKTSRQRFLKSVGDDPEFAGVRLMYYYSFKTSDSQKTTNIQRPAEEVVVHFDNGIIKNGKRFYELGIDGKLFMEDLYSKVKSKGAILIHKHFDNVEEVYNLQESLIINCTSMGSRELFNDQEFIPVRGQHIYFKSQEDVDYLLYQNVPNDPNTWVTIYPWQDRIILGGIEEYGEEELIKNQEAIDKIIQNTEKYYKCSK